jgi:hypothetical protein
MSRTGRFVAIAVLSGIVLVGAALWLRPARAAGRPGAGSTTGRTLQVRVWEPGGVAPSVSVDVPVVLVTAVLRIASTAGILDRSLVSACDDVDQGACPRIRGADLAAIWGQIAAAGPLRIVDVDDGAGSRVQIRID